MNKYINISKFKTNYLKMLKSGLKNKYIHIAAIGKSQL